MSWTLLGSKATCILSQGIAVSMGMLRVRLPSTELYSIDGAISICVTVYVWWSNNLHYDQLRNNVLYINWERWLNKLTYFPAGRKMRYHYAFTIAIYGKKKLEGTDCSEFRRGKTVNSEYNQAIISMKSKTTIKFFKKIWSKVQWIWV